MWEIRKLDQIGPPTPPFTLSQVEGPALRKGFDFAQRERMWEIRKLDQIGPPPRSP